MITSRLARFCTRSGLVSALLLALVLPGCSPASVKTPASVAVTLPGHVRVGSGGRITSVPLDEYVLGSSLAEVTPIDETPQTVARIYEVQAILARTYVTAHLGRHRAEGFDVCDTTHCQLFDPSRANGSRFAIAARSAVARTAGVILEYSQRPADALFHSDCGGVTAAADATWGGPSVPYLLSAPDDAPAVKHRTWSLTVPVQRLLGLLSSDSRARIGTHLDKLDVIARDFSERAMLVTVSGDRTAVLRGDQLRSLVNQALGDHAMLSTRFTVVKRGDAFVFEGSGFGHGVGLCQAGAAARARQGQATDDILTHYFPGVTVTKEH